MKLNMCCLITNYLVIGVKVEDFAVGDKYHKGNTEHIVKWKMSSNGKNSVEMKVWNCPA